MSHKIEIDCDCIEAEEFCAWLNAHGHDAKIGRSTANYIDGVWTSTNDDARATMNALWSAYCND